MDTFYCSETIHDVNVCFSGQFKLLTEMFHITHSALHVGLTTTIKRYNKISRLDTLNVLSVWETSFSFGCNQISLLEKTRRADVTIFRVRMLISYWPIGIGNSSGSSRGFFSENEPCFLTVHFSCSCECD